MKPFFVYMLRCRDGSYYIGHTDELELRMSQHAQGNGCEYTRTRLPIELVWTAEVDSRAGALMKERQLKGWSRAKKEALTRSDWTAIQRLSRRRSR